MKRLLFLAAALAVLALPGLCPAAGPALPEAMTPEQLGALLEKPGADLEVVDVRPPAQFADYFLPGSINLDPAALLADSAILAGAGQLVIVDKDGSQAMALAGMLSLKTKRPVAALKGGLAAWWAARELAPVVKEVALPQGAVVIPAAAPAGASGLPAGQAPTAPSPGGPGQAPAAPAKAPGQQNAPAAPAAPQPPANKNAGC